MRHRAAFWALCLAISTVAPLWSQRLQDLAAADPMVPGTTLVVGFLGGFEHWDDPHRSVRQLAHRLNKIPGVHAETVANHRRKIALEWMIRCLDTNHDGHLDGSERTTARVVLYGQSLGAAAAIETARDLEKIGVSVLLTAQVDSVGIHDGVIPPNVHQAVNFFQHDPLTFQGQTKIRAEDPSRTVILGNFPSSYLFRSVNQSQSTWIRRTLGGSHAKMEADPVLWKQVEMYIVEAIRRE
jgi:hypothetical protein